MPAFETPWTVRLDDDENYNDLSFKTRIDPAKQSVFMLQSVYKHHFQPESKFEISQTGAGSGKQQLKTGKAGGNWGSVSQGQAGIALSIANFAKTFPKEIEVDGNGITAHLWSSKGGRNLDYRASTLVDFYDRNWFDKGAFPGGAKNFSALYSNASGSSRTHELGLSLFGNQQQQQEVPAIAQLVEKPVYLIQDPHWLRTSDAMGPMHPYDPENFPRLENFLKKFFTEVEKRIDVNGDYGFLDFGNGPHWYKGGPSYKGHPRFYRYYNMEYQFRTVLWMMFARSGDRAYADFALPYNHHLNDFIFSHWDNQGKPTGAMLSVGDSITPLYWMNRASFWGSQGITMQNYYDGFYLTGDRRLLDGTRNFAKHVIKEFDPYILPGGVSNGITSQPYQYLSEMYGATWNEDLGKLLAISRNQLIDLDNSSGMASLEINGSWYKLSSRMIARLRDYQATGSKAAMESMRRYAEWVFKNKPTPDPGYQNYDGSFLNYVYQATKDKRCVDWIAEHLARVLFNFSDEKGNLTKTPYHGNHNLTFFMSTPHAMDLIHKNRDKIAAWPRLLAEEDIYIQKDPGQSINIDLKHGQDFDIQVVDVFDKNRLRQRGHYRTGYIGIESQSNYFSKDASAGLIPGFSRITMYKDTLAGQYRLKDVSKILSTDATKMVRFIPKGAWLTIKSTRKPKWYFKVPENTKGAIYGNKTFRLVRDGKTEAVEAGKWKNLEAGDKDKLYQIDIDSRTFIRFKGDIPALIARDDPSLYFIPKSNMKPVPVIDKIQTDNEFVKGISNDAKDQAYLLNGKRKIKIPQGKKIAGRRKHEYIDYDKGTIEFWFKPQWTSNMLTKEVKRSLLRNYKWQITCQNYLGDGTDDKYYALKRPQLTFFAPAAVRKVPYANQENRQFIELETGKWYHLALCWEYNKKTGIFGSEMYIDGKPSFGLWRATTGLTRTLYNKKWNSNWDVATPQRPFEFIGDFDGVIDEIRVSSEPRYRKGFDKPGREPFEKDNQTLLLYHCDGNLEPIKK